MGLPCGYYTFRISVSHFKLSYRSMSSTKFTWHTITLIYDRVLYNRPVRAARMTCSSMLQTFELLRLAWLYINYIVHIFLFYIWYLQYCSILLSSFQSSPKNVSAPIIFGINLNIYHDNQVSVILNPGDLAIHRTFDYTMSISKSRIEYHLLDSVVQFRVSSLS